MLNKYWTSYKNEFKNKWHFDPKKKTTDFYFLGNLNTGLLELLNIANKEVKKKPLSQVLSADKNFSKRSDRKTKAFKDWGYTKEVTNYLQIFSEDYPNVFKPLIAKCGLDYATSSIVYQPPGNIIPWHYDTHAKFHEKLKNRGVNHELKLIRYMLFLTDWSWGHYFAVGNSVVHQWKMGDLITWSPHMHHCGSNAGMEPKITVNITGVITKKSLHKKKGIKIKDL
jgi:hypothetical protein